VKIFLFLSLNVSEIHEATPFHNASTLAALVAGENEDLKKSTLTSQQNVLDALILCKIWLRQRGLDQVSEEALSTLWAFL